MQLLDRLLPLDDSSLWFAVDVGLKATLLLGVAAAMTVVLRAGSAAVRHRIWAITFAALLVLPLANGTLPGWSWRVIPRDWQRQTEFNPFADSRPSRSDPAAIGTNDGFGPRNPTVTSQNQVSNLKSQISNHFIFGVHGTTDGAREDSPRLGCRLRSNCAPASCCRFTIARAAACLATARLARRDRGGAFAAGDRHHRQSAVQAARGAIGRC